MLLFCSIGFATAGVLAENTEDSRIEIMLEVSPNPALRKTAAPIDRSDKETIALLKEMAEYLDDCIWPKGGMALPQVGVSKRGFVVMVDDDPVIMINPRVNVKGNQVASLEECISLPDISGYVYRWDDVTVEYYDEAWHYKSARLDDIEAFAIQHENDHLNGILIADKFLPNKYNDSEKSAIMLD